MKKTYKYIALAALALGFTACSQDDDFAPQQEDIVKIASANIATEVQTRVNTLDDGTAWEENDQILLVNNSRDDKNSGTYTYNGTAWSLTGGIVIYASGTDATNSFTAYYPASVDFTLPTDQSTETGIKSADRMTATATGIAKGAAVALNFERQNAKVTIVPDITDEYGSSATISELTIGSITPYHPTGATDYTAIIAPTLGFEATVKVKVGDSEQTLTAPCLFEIEAGKQYSIALQVGKDVVTVNSVSVNPWTDNALTDTEAKEVKVTVTTNGTTATLTIPELATDAMVQKAMQEFNADGITTITANGNLSDAMHAAIISAISKKNTQGAVTNGKLSESSVTYTVHPAFTEALTAWTDTDGATLTLLADTPECTDNIVIVDKTLTLDLNGHALNGSSSKFIQVGESDPSEGTSTEGGLTICDSGTGGAVNMTKLDILAGSVNLQGGTLNHWVENQGTFNMTGGKIVISSTLAIKNSGGTLNISGGELSGWNGIIANKGSVNISGSPVITGTDFNGNGGAAIDVSYDDVTVIISGTPTLKGDSYGEIAAYYPVTLNTQPTTGKWRIYTTERMITNNNGIHVFAKPGEGIDLDATKFESLVDGYEVQKQDDGSLALVATAEGEGGEAPLLLTNNLPSRAGDVSARQED